MRRRIVATLPLLILLAAVAACGSAEPGPSEPVESDDAQPLVIRSADLFTVDSFSDAGFKKSKEFSTATVPDSTAIWYGFYSQRDVEIRFYGSHEMAIGAGVESARAAVGRSPNSNIGGGIITSSGNRTQYGDFLVAGNTVILCQTDAAPCVELANLLQVTR